MKNLYYGSDGILRGLPGSEINNTVLEAIQLAGQQKELINLNVSRITIAVRESSDLMLIVRDWWRALYGCIDKKVGPYPSSLLSEEEQWSHDLIMAAYYEACMRWDADYDEVKAAVTLSTF